MRSKYVHSVACAVSPSRFTSRRRYRHRGRCNPPSSMCCNYCCVAYDHLHCRSFSYEEFIAAQAKFQKRQSEQLVVLNEEVARAIDDVITLVQVSMHCFGMPSKTAPAIHQFVGRLLVPITHLIS